MPMGMPEWDEKAESAQEINRAFNDVLDVLVDADMWTGDPPYRGVSAAEQVKMLVRRAEAAEAEAQAHSETCYSLAHDLAQAEAALAAVPVKAFVRYFQFPIGSQRITAVQEQADLDAIKAWLLNRQKKREVQP